MKQNNEATTDVLRAFGVVLLILGLIFTAAWWFNRADALAFKDGFVVEGTVEQIWEGDSPGVQIRFVDSNGRFQRSYLEATTADQRAAWSVGDSVVAIQMRDSPLRLRLAEDVEARRQDATGLILAVGLMLPGLLLVSRKRPFGSPANQQQMATRQQHLASGSLFLFAGLLLLVGFFAVLTDPDIHWLGKLIFGAFALLTGGGMTLSGIRSLWQAWRNR
ncbi:MAG: hypothetical protein KC434_03915 [Anaerolineales bacterium]|nr:hypothetical protein [Anaerolineales bacterium]